MAEDILWRPSEELLADAPLTSYVEFLRETRGLEFDDYRELWEWSCRDLEGLWGSVWEHFGLDEVSSYDRVLAQDTMPGARWFPGATVNFAERCLARGEPERAAILEVHEGTEPVALTYADLRGRVGAVAAALREWGVRPGDAVAAYVPNTADTIVAFLASAAVGAVWTSVSPDFAPAATIARFGQAKPVVLLTSGGYQYGGKHLDRTQESDEIAAALPTVRHRCEIGGPEWAEIVAEPTEPVFEATDFDHPLWVLWSSGTTGTPKGIVHGHGGIVVEFYKAHALNEDLRADDVYYFVTTPSWMVWNYMVGGLLLGCTIVACDGNPAWPDVNGAWRVAEQTGATVLGCGAGYLIAGHRAAAQPGRAHDLSRLRAIQQTGSTLPDETWTWTTEQTNPGVWLQSISGGTDICSVLVGPAPWLPVRVGRIPGPYLGVALESWSEDGRPLVGEQGELVLTRPLPSMPLYFVGDETGERYRDAYFDLFPGTWRHGDWVTVAEDLSVTIGGRSDATLNRQGVRIGSADLYGVLDHMPELADSLVIGVELADGGYWMPLFVVPAEGHHVDEALVDRIKQKLRSTLSPRHVPDEVIEVPVIPRTPTGKRMEVPVKRVLLGADPTSEDLSHFTTHRPT